MKTSTIKGGRKKRTEQDANLRTGTQNWDSGYVATLGGVEIHL